MRDAGWLREPIMISDNDLMELSLDELAALEELTMGSATGAEVWREDGPFGTRIKVLDRPSLTDLPRL